MVEKAEPSDTVVGHGVRKSMFKDKSLVPNEAIRLAALGLLAEQAHSYANLASEVRHFTGRLVGPSLDLIGAPLELLRYEGLVESDNMDQPGAGDAVLSITATGRAALRDLVCAPVREPINDVGRLVIALKLRFLSVLDDEARAVQLELLQEIYERELARLEDLRAGSREGTGLLDDWLDLDIAAARKRLDWLAAQVG